MYKLYNSAYPTLLSPPYRTCIIRSWSCFPDSSLLLSVSRPRWGPWPTTGFPQMLWWDGGGPGPPQDFPKCCGGMVGGAFACFLLLPFPGSLVPGNGGEAAGNGTLPFGHCPEPPVINIGVTHGGPVPRLLAAHQKPWYRTTRVYSSLDLLRSSGWSCTGVGIPCAGLLAAWSGPE